MQAEVSPLHYDDLILNWIFPQPWTLNHITEIFWKMFGNCLELWNQWIPKHTNSFVDVLDVKTGPTEWHHIHIQVYVCINCTHVHTCNMWSMDVKIKSVCLGLCAVRALKHTAEFSTRVSKLPNECSDHASCGLGWIIWSSLTITMPYPHHIHSFILQFVIRLLHEIRTNILYNYFSDSSMSLTLLSFPQLNFIFPFVCCTSSHFRHPSGFIVHFAG